MQFKEYSTHLEHHLKDTCSRSADFVAKQQAYGEALSTFGAQAHNMSKYEQGSAATAFMELQAAAEKVASMHEDASKHVNRCVSQSHNSSESHCSPFCVFRSDIIRVCSFVHAFTSL